MIDTNKTGKTSKEEWRPVVGYEGYYEVSNLGRVRSLDRVVKRPRGSMHLHKGRVLQVQYSKGGYVCVYLRNGTDGPKTKSVHRLVAQAFIPNPKNKPQVNHKNRVKNDNKESNLEWCTREENMRHALETGFRVSIEVTESTYLNSESVLAICELLDTTNLAHAEIASKFNVNPDTVSSINTGHNWNWLTNRLENVELRKNSRGENHPRSRAVVNCRGEKFLTSIEAATRYGLRKGNLSTACSGGKKSCGKYEDGTPIKWRYINE
jgi:hypothetical protein